MVGLAFEVHDTYNRKKKQLKLNEKINESLKSSLSENNPAAAAATSDNSNAKTSNSRSMEKLSEDTGELSKLKLEIEFLSLDPPRPNIFQVFLYAYCYIGLLTGPYFKYRTYHDWLVDNKHSSVIDSIHFLIKRGRIAPFIIIGFLVLSKFFSFQVKESGLLLFT
jgi:hypothetical protein